MPPEHVRPPVQVAPHAPQFVGSPLVSTQTPLHAEVPAGQTHVPPEHSCPPVQVVPQTPQLLWLLLVSTQAPLHTV